jgi:hypothetical protein
MEHSFDESFISICRDILSEGKTIEEWALIESSDMFQTEKYIGGFDATEMEFTFSLYEDGREYWFQMPLSNIEDVVNGRISNITISEADY